MDKDTQEQVKNKVDKRLEALKPYQYKKGQSGNPGGRPKGISLKEYARNKLLSMTEDEREEFFNGLSKDTIWEMAEGKPKQDTDLTSKGERILILPTELIQKSEST